MIAQNATTTAVIVSPCCDISYAPPTMVVLAWRPTAESPISGAVLATMNRMAAASVSASGRSIGSVGRVARVWPHRGQRALPPGGTTSGSICEAKPFTVALMT
jgi:hypothetical protein